MYEVTLSRQGESKRLKCTLRPVNGGRRLLLYLSEEPFHQLCYASTSREPEPPAPEPLHTGGARFFDRRGPEPDPDPRSVTTRPKGAGFFERN
jgi:hypothetical protein